MSRACEHACLSVSANRPQVAVRSRLYEDRGEMLLGTIQHLPALAELAIYYDGDVFNLVDAVDDRHALPRCEELARLLSRSLTRLSVCMIDGPVEGIVLRLGRPPELLSCALQGDAQGPELSMRIDASTFQGAPKLRDFHLVFGEDMDLQPRGHEQLTALTELSLSACGLQCVPAGVASLSATLRVLDLSDNDRLQLDDAAVSTFIQCSLLTKLSLAKTELPNGRTISLQTHVQNRRGMLRLRGACRVYPT